MVQRKSDEENLRLQDFDNCSLIEKESEIASLIEYQDKQIPKKESKKNPYNWLELRDKSLIILQKPSVFIVIVLFLVVLVLSLQLSGQQKQLDEMSVTILKATNRETELSKQVKNLNSQVSHV